MTLVIDTYRALRDPKYRDEICEYLETCLMPEDYYEAAAVEIERLCSVIQEAYDDLCESADGQEAYETLSREVVAWRFEREDTQ